MESALVPIPKLKFDAPVRPPRKIGLPGVQRWIPLTQLYIDPDYQRQVLAAGRQNIRRMVEDFSWALFGSLVVGQRGPEQFAVIDGQHRACAALYRGDIDEVPCLVLTGGKKHEALAFSTINSNVTRIHPLQAFYASVTAGDPDSVATVEICKQAAVKIVAYPKQDLREGETQSLTNLRRSIKLYGDGVVIAGLKMLRAIDPTAGLPNAAIEGAINLVRRNLAWQKDPEAAGQSVRRALSSFLQAAAERKVSYGGKLSLNFEAVLTTALQAESRVAGRFMSDDARRRAMAGR